jgi:hypothetical protein
MNSNPGGYFTVSLERRASRGTLAIVAAVFCTACACRAPDRSAATSARHVDHHRLRARSVESFDRAVFFKPREGGGGVDISMLPLIVQEVPARTEELADDERFGEVGVNNDGRTTIDSSRPTVYVDLLDETQTTVGHAQLTACWWYPAQREGSAPTMRGVRMTMDSSGSPVVWEALSDDRTGHLLFVSQSLETSAKVQFGPRLPGRVFALERSTVVRPDVIVARIIDDGPVPMGPFVYIMSDSLDIATVTCRCMASQVDAFVNDAYYEVLPLSTLPDAFRATAAPIPLETLLRLPDDF